MSEGKLAGPTNTSKRLADLRTLMNKNPKVDAYLIPSEDQHSSEYLALCDERRAFISGFTGSAGTALVLQDSAMLFTDGRYFLQAGKQLDQNWTLMKQGLPQVPTWQEYLSKNLPAKSRIGFDPTLISIGDFEDLEKSLKPLESTLVPTSNLVDTVWGSERPTRPSNPVFPLEEKYTGKSCKTKISELREVLEKKKATATVITQLDEVAWLFNLRGSDIPFNPVFFAYACVTPSKVTLFTNKERLTPETVQLLEEDQVSIEPYDQVIQHLEANPLYSGSEKVLIGKKTSVAVVNAIGKDNVIIDRAPVTDAKSIKTDAEIEGFRQSHIRDGSALARYFSWLEVQLQAGAKISESEGADKLEHYRKQLDLFMGLSFPTISSTGPNGAIIHYQPDPNDCAIIQKDQVYLCDSGAQFKDGTTDTTRTWHFGEPTADEIRAFTRVLQGHISIDTLIIPPETSGLLIDSLARKFLWEDGMDYRHGTGHGVGHFLNVHEGPQGIGKRIAYNDTPLKAGMTLSNEPGYYADGKFGIRIENIVVVRNAETRYRFDDAQYLGFEHVTMSPMHRKLIDKSLLSPQELKWLNLYHAEVLHKVGPLLQGKNEDDIRALAWLERECGVHRMLAPFLAKKALRCRHHALVGHYTLRYASNASVELSDVDRARLLRQRNIGVSAHIDSGKTTLTERILFYTGRINAIHEVRGRDNVGAKMDSMDLEREKGITIQSAATFCDWKTKNPITGEKEDYSINIIDTPGHVDFTIEVERALRVLDGAILVLCAVSGVQSQTITVDRQMRRYNVPRISFINKMDRPGANPKRVIQQIRTKLRIPAAAVHVPIGAEDELTGMVDLVRWKAVYNRGVKGIEVVEEDEIPAAVLQEAKDRRAELIETLAEVDEQMSDAFLEDVPITTELLVGAIRRATIARKFTPVFLGSAVKNTAVQPLLDGICAYLPTPSDSTTSALDLSKPTGEQAVDLTPAAEAPLVALAFKLEEGKYGQLTYMRVYQGSIKKGGWIFHAKTNKRVKVPRLVRMHSDDMEDIESIGPGEICAIFGIECASGDTFTDGQTSLSMTSMFVPEPVISLAIKPEGTETPNFSKALNRFKKEDPTFRVHVDSESQETIISGMGELHLEIYAERMKREYNVPCITGKPQVAFRETITAPSKFNYTHKKQTGGAGQFARVIGSMEPEERDPETGKDICFENVVMSGNVPNNFIPAVEKGFMEAMEKGSLAGCPVNGVKYTLEDGAFHAVDSSELAFRLAAIGSFREAYKNASPVILEPIMNVEITAPVEFQGNVIGGVNQRRGTIIDTDVRDDEFTLIAEVSLNDMFGYSSALRGATQGKGEFSMEYKEHQPVLPHVQKEMADAYRKKLEGKSK